MITQVKAKNQDQNFKGIYKSKLNKTTKID